MSEIRRITTDDLRHMEGKEGLIIQGCGGDLQEWVDGVNDELTERGVLKDGTRFDNVSVFETEGLTCLLFPFDENVNLDVGRFAMWRLQSYQAFAGTWLSDYVDNRLGGFVSEPEQSQDSKPDCPLIGQDGNIFNLVGIASRTLRSCGMGDEAREMSGRVLASGSYTEALGIIGEYVNVTSVDDEPDDDYDGDPDDYYDDEDDDEDFGGMNMQ